MVTASFRLYWTAEDWVAAADSASTPTVVGIEFVDIPIALEQRAPIRCTFFWPRVERWEGRDFEINVESIS